MSIKVISADRTEHSHELEALRGLQETQASGYIVKLLDDFIHHGPNGCHQCIVFELLGPSVDTIVNDYRNVGDQLDPETILRITTQLLRVVSCIHAVGCVHGG